MNYTAKNFWKSIGNLYPSKGFFGSNKNINYQIKFSLNLPWIYIVHINNFFTPDIKYVIRGIFCWGNCPWGTILQENVFGELSVGKIPSGLSLSGNYPDTSKTGYNPPEATCFNGCSFEILIVKEALTPPVITGLPTLY